MTVYVYWNLIVLGSKGKTRKHSLSSWANDFEAGHTDEYKIQAMDVGEVLLVHLYNDGSGFYSDWFVNKITVTSSKQDETFHFPCYRWIVDDMVVFQGKGKPLQGAIFSCVELIAQTFVQVTKHLSKARDTKTASANIRKTS